MLGTPQSSVQNIHNHTLCSTFKLNYISEFIVDTKPSQVEDKFRQLSIASWFLNESQEDFFWMLLAKRPDKASRLKESFCFNAKILVHMCHHIKYSKLLGALRRARERTDFEAMIYNAEVCLSEYWETHDSKNSATPWTLWKKSGA